MQRISAKCSLILYHYICQSYEEQRIVKLFLPYCNLYYPKYYHFEKKERKKEREAFPKEAVLAPHFLGV